MKLKSFSPNSIYRQLLPIYLVDLLEDVVDVPYLHGPVDGRGDDVVPGAHSEWFQLNNSSKMGIEDFDKLRCF